MKDAGGALLTPNSGLRRLPRQHAAPRDPVKEARRPHMESIFTTLARRGHRAERPLSGVGLHGRRAARSMTERCSSCATTPSTGSAPRRRRSSSTQRRGRRRHAASSGASPAPSTSSAYVDSPTPPARFVLDANGLPDPPGDARSRRRFVVQHPARRARRAPPARRSRRARRSTATASSARTTEVSGRQRPGHGERAQLRLLRDQVDRHVGRRHRRHAIGILQELSQLPDAHRPPAAVDGRTSSSSRA